MLGMALDEEAAAGVIAPGEAFLGVIREDMVCEASNGTAGAMRTGMWGEQGPVKTRMNVRRHGRQGVNR